MSVFSRDQLDKETKRISDRANVEKVRLCPSENLSPALPLQTQEEGVAQDGLWLVLSTKHKQEVPAWEKQTEEKDLMENKRRCHHKLQSTRRHAALLLTSVLDHSRSVPPSRRRRTSRADHRLHANLRRVSVRRLRREDAGFKGQLEKAFERAERWGATSVDHRTPRGKTGQRVV